MRTTVTIDDDLLREAKRLSGISENAELIRHAMKRFVEREAAARLARLGGTMPDLDIPPRRRIEPEEDVEA